MNILLDLVIRSLYTRVEDGCDVTDLRSLDDLEADTKKSIEEFAIAILKDIKERYLSCRTLEEFNKDINNLIKES